MVMRSVKIHRGFKVCMMLLWYQRGEYAYAQKNGTKVPFLSQPPRHYTGKAWYQKTIFVPEKQMDLLAV